MPAAELGYETYGQGPDTIVLLHPTGLGPVAMTPIAECLAPAARVIVVHRRGYGASSAAPLPSTLDDHLDDLDALLDHLGLTSTTLIGVSAGATIALAYAARTEHLRHRVLAHEPLLGRAAPLLQARVSGRIDRLLRRRDEPHELSLFVSELVGIDTWNHLPPDWRDGVEANRVAALAEAPFYGSFDLTDAELDLLGRRTSVTSSVGERSGATRQEAATVLRSHHVPVFVVPGAGHLVSCDAPRAFAGIALEVATLAVTGNPAMAPARVATGAEASP